MDIKKVLIIGAIVLAIYYLIIKPNNKKNNKDIINLPIAPNKVIKYTPPIEERAKSGITAGAGTFGGIE